MVIPEVCAWLENSSVGTAIRQSTWLFPTIETIHVLATVMVVGSVTMLDLRLLNLASRDRSVTELHREILPWTWASFFVAVTAGFFLFTSSATKYYHNGPFRTKMVLLVLVGINAAFFEFRTFRGVASWDQGARIPRAAKIAGGVGILLWIFVVACGRWIGFTK